MKPIKRIVRCMQKRPNCPFALYVILDLKFSFVLSYLNGVTFCFLLLFSYIDGLVQDCSNSIANEMELLQSCTKPHGKKNLIQLSLGVTVLLALTVFLLLVAETMPSQSDSIPLIGMSHLHRLEQNFIPKCIFRRYDSNHIFQALYSSVH